MMLEKTIRQIQAAAVIFAKRGGCSAQDIADSLNTPLSIVYRFRKQPIWDETLDTLGYTGDRNFTVQPRRDVLRDSGELIAQCRGLYLVNRRAGLNHKKAVTAVTDTLAGETFNERQGFRRRVNTWCKRYNWEDAL